MNLDADGVFLEEEYHDEWYYLSCLR
jgi:hypothetical protein